MTNEAEEARKRRLARLQEQPKPADLPDPSVEEARKRRLEREKNKPAEEETPTPEKAVISNGKAVSEASKEALCYFEKNFTVEFHGDKYKFFADNEMKFALPTKDQDAKKKP